MKSSVKHRRSSTRRRRKSSRRPWLLFFRLFVVVLFASIAWCLYAAWYLNHTIPELEEGTRADAGIVLGAALWNDVPSPALKERLDYAYQLYKDGVVEVLILSGGYGGVSSKLSEAEGMRNYLTSKGMAEDKLILEMEAGNTYENLVFGKRIGEEAGYSEFVVITHDYHAPRAKEMAEFAGFEPALVTGVKSRVLNQFYNDSREVLAYTKWKLDSVLMRIGFLSR
ncbi:YdcF family protein [Paenibacillus agaridevorans]|uniref:YdcF family protein n=1 Tax=Paenibacillus agaridevorans TaxID=171404 RepID=UPI001BE3EDCB|nr:YdcF family protein [Paenibacillus agaridevorans]